MGFFNFLKGKTKIKGSIGYFGLADWWLSAFSDQERQYILNKFQPLGSSGNSLTCGEITYTSETAIGLLSALAGWFSSTDDRPIAHKILEKAEELSHSGAQILDVHFLYHEMIGIYYKDRENPKCMEKAVYACRQQIGLAPQAATAFMSTYKKSPLPSHTGYEQLAIILEREGRYREAIDLCEQAAKQGWAGSWRQRIERCEKRMEKSSSAAAAAPFKPRKRKAE
jgi:tetratricopeptide (TPR) repeat protein